MYLCSSFRSFFRLAWQHDFCILEDAYCIWVNLTFSLSVTNGCNFNSCEKWQLNFQMKHFLWCSSTFSVVTLSEQQMAATFLKNSEIIPKPSRFSSGNWRNAMRFHWSKFLKNSWSRCLQLLYIWSTLLKSNQNSCVRTLEEFF